MKLKELRRRALAGTLSAAMLLSSAGVVYAAPEDAAESERSDSESGQNTSEGTADGQEDESNTASDSSEQEASESSAAETPAEEDIQEDYEELEEAVKRSSAAVRDGKVRVSIVMDQDSTLGSGYSVQDIAENASARSYRDRILSNQEQVENRISRQILDGDELEVVWNITLAGNMISAWVPVDSLSELTEVRGVEDVIIETRYEAPKTGSGDAEQPNMTVSGDMTDSVNVWGNGADGYTGAGTQVAIIDTGFDSDHQSFAEDAFLYSIDQIREAGREVTLMTQADVENIWDQLNASKINSSVTYSADQVYRNEKVPFGFNYVDNSLEITHDNDDQGDHGSHVSGIAAANRYIKNEAGEYVSALDTVLTQGQAPDAQVVVMKVFGEEGGAFDSDYMVAIEDAMLLGCESINLSLGSTQPGFSADVTSSSNRYNAIFEALTSSNSTVNIAAGNSYNWADNASTGGVIYSDDVNFDMVGKPGSYRNSMAVASVNNDGMTGNYVTVDGKNIFYNETKHSNQPLTTMAREEAYEYIYIDGTATTEETAALADILKDKIVVCRRGDITFVEKAENIANAGGAAAFIANNTSGVIALDLSDYTHTQPVAALTQEDGNYLRDHGTEQSKDGVTYYEGTLTITDAIGNFKYDSEYYTLSDFSSWGIPGSLKMKPEITAPGGNIYSINGSAADGTSYRNGSGTSMATPQITGITAVVAQYAQENGLAAFAEENGFTLRAVEQALLMGTAAPVKDEATGNYYPVIRQGAGLVNLEDATRANTLIMMHDTATDSAADGKVKAEIGDDPDRSGTFEVKFTVYNTSDEPQSLDLSGEFFTQQYAEADGISYMTGSTAVIPSDITWLVNGTVLSADGGSDVNALYDFNGDGVYNREDARAVLAYAVGKTDAVTSNPDNADLDKDGDIDTYDAYLALHQNSAAAGAVVPANDSIRVTAQVQITMPAELDDKGNYIEGYLFAEEQSSAEGEAGITQSIPVLGYYGSWTGPSMYDRGSTIDKNHGTETRTPYAAEVGDPANAISYYVESGTVTYDVLTFGENPFMQDETYHPERAAINKESKISNINYSLIRNSAKTRFIVEDGEGNEYFLQQPNGTEYGAYYNTASSEDTKWENIPSQMYLNKNSDKTKNFTTSTLSKVPEGTMLRFALESAPEYYVGEDGSINWGALGDGAKIEVNAVMDTTAPELVSAEGIRDESGNLTGIRVTVKDENYIAGAQLLQGSFMNLEKQGAPEEQTKGGEVTFIFTGVKDDVTEYSIAVFDYAANKSLTKVSAEQLGFEEKQDTETPETAEEHAEADPDSAEEPEEHAEAGSEEAEETGKDLKNEKNSEAETSDEADSSDGPEAEAAKTRSTVSVPTGSLSEVKNDTKTVSDASSGDHKKGDESQNNNETDVVSGNSAVKEISESGKEITISIMTEKALTNGKYEILFDSEQVTVTEVKGLVSDFDHQTEEGKLTLGFIHDIALSENYGVGEIVLKVHSGTGSVTVNTVEENNGSGDSTSVYSYKDGSFKEEEEKPHEHSFGEWKAEADYSGIYRQCTGCEEKEAYENPFRDVKGGNFFVPILWASKEGITSGKTAEQFFANDSCTRGQVVTFLWSAAGKPEPERKTNPFVDVQKSSPFYKAILWAAENGITSGTDSSHFSPSAGCTRGQIVTFLYRYAGSPEITVTENPYKDVRETSPFYKAILWASENNITKGITADTFGLNRTCTRGQTVTFLYQYFMK